MQRYTHGIAWILLIAICTSLVPASTAHATNLSDVLPQTLASAVTANTNTGSGGSLLDILWGLLAETFLGKFIKIDSSLAGSGGAASLPSPEVKELIGFYAEWWGGDTASFNSFSQNIDQVRTIAPFWAILESDGTLTNRGGADHAAVVQFARKYNKEVLLLVNNAKEAQQGVLPVHTVLRSKALRSKAIASIEAYIKNYGLNGVNVDFEMVPASDKAYLTVFMKELSARLRPQGYTVSIDVFPKQNENNEVAAAYDYAELTKYADKIIIMTYDNHGAWSGPGPIADIRWVEESLKYALKFIPKSKLYLGIAAYGYDWAGEKVESVEHKQISALIQQYKPAVRWDEPSKSPYFTYKGTDGLNHQVWFENAHSISYKLDLANKYDIAGAAMWRLGGEDVGYWRTIRDKFR